MSKIKDTIEEKQRFADQELEANEPKDYKFSAENHCHTFQGRPLLGTSTIVGVIAKPLTWWASGLAVKKFGWLDPKKNSTESVLNALKEGYKRVLSLSLEDYSKLLGEAYKAHSVNLKDTAQAGTDLHEELEKYVKDRISGEINKSYHSRIHPFIDWAEENVEKFLWSELHCFSENMWVGGISDCGVKLKNGKVGIIDFKSSKDSYESQFIQCAGYDLQITENGGYTFEGKKVYQLNEPIEFYAIVPFGADKFQIDFRFNVNELKEGFKSALVLHKLVNK